MSKQRRRQARRENNPLTPLPFTGDICDYPLLNGISQDGVTGTWSFSSIISAYMTVNNQIASGEMDEIEATYHFPNFAYTYVGVLLPNATSPDPNSIWGPTPEETGNTANVLYGSNMIDAPQVQWQDLRDYFIENEGLGDSLNFEQYGGSGFGFTDRQALFGYVHYMLDAGIPLGCWVEPTDYTVPFPYTGDPCDYPMIVDENNMITAETIQTLYGSIWDEYGPVGATHHLPDFNEDGEISTGDLLTMLRLIPISCDLTPPPPPPPVDEDDTVGFEYGSPIAAQKNKGKIIKKTTTSTERKHRGLEDLYTSGNEYTLPSGKIYVGAYHIHPTGGAMVGPKHTSAPHAKLTKLPPLKAQIPARSKGGKISKKQTTNQQTTRGSSNGY